MTITATAITRSSTPTVEIDELPPRPARFNRYLRETALLVGRALRMIPVFPSD